MAAGGELAGGALHLGASFTSATFYVAVVNAAPCHACHPGLGSAEACVRALLPAVHPPPHPLDCRRYLTLRYDAVVAHLPAVGILQAPPARVEDRLYVPPPMRHHAVGWVPEWGKAWYGYGAPRYGF